MKKLIRLLCPFATIALVTVVARAELKPGDAFPTPVLVGLGASAQSDYTGKIVVVDFWASWCAPCKASFPALGKIATAYAGRGVVFVGVSVDENAGAYAAFVKKFAPPFPTLHDAKQSLARVVQVPAMPTTYLVDGAGRVRAIHQGFHGEASDRQLRTEIDALLARKG